MSIAKQEIEHVRFQLWSVRGRNSRRLGNVLLLISITLLAVGYFTHYVAFEATAILAFLLGVILQASNLEPHVKLRPASYSILPLLQVFASLNHLFRFQGRSIFIPRKTGEVKLFLPTTKLIDSSIIAKMVDEGDEAAQQYGLLLPSPGQGLFNLYQEELGEVQGANLMYLFEWLPRTMVNGLGLCLKAEMILVGEQVHTVITKPYVRDLCQRSEVKDSVCHLTGCPLSSSIADVLAMSTGRPISHVDCRYDPLRQEAYLMHQFVGAVVINTS